MSRIYYVVTRMHVCPELGDAIIRTEVFNGDWTLVKKCDPEFVWKDRARAALDRQHRTMALAFAGISTP